ncbi:MAG TPA: ornithine carbamoyltransferase [Acidimicrobiales bacterium]|nr:ornithine carbamoyltransferase [Acidimicrobiales bacterium]
MALKDLLRVADLGLADLHHVLDLSDELRSEPYRYHYLLRGDTVITYFAKPSTRTRLSFGSAIARLGGTPEVVGPTELQLGRGETIEDTARVISRYARAFVIRTFADDDVCRFADAASIPVVNALTDLHHPCQALADLLTLRNHFGQLDGLKLAYVGDGNNVAHSLLEACALTGMDIAVASPPGFEPDAAIREAAEKLAAASGCEIVVTHDPFAAVRDADAIYTDVWLSMGDDEAERAHRIAALTPFRVTAELLAAGSARCVFMHCLPAHRGEEVAAEVIDGPHSVVLDQAENRMHTAQALLLALLRGELRGA